MRIALLLFCLSLTTGLAAQKVLQIEKYGSPKTTKIYIGDPISYQLKGEKSFRLAYIEDIRPKDSLLVLGDRYVNVYDIAALRYERAWPEAVSQSLFWFGTGWSGFAAIGFSFDGNDETSYRWADAFVTLTSWSLAYALPKLFKNKDIKFGDRRRLRLLDLRFSEDPGAY